MDGPPGSKSKELLFANADRNVAEAEAMRARSRYAQLTSREREILALLVEESAIAASRQIAGKLGISPRTIDTHRRRITNKLHVYFQADLRLIAIQYGALDPTLRNTYPLRTDVYEYTHVEIYAQI